MLRIETVCGSKSKLKMASEKIDPGDIIYREIGYRISSMMERKLKWRTRKIYFKNYKDSIIYEQLASQE